MPRPRRSRPFRGTVYLPGHDETGHGVAVAKISAATQEGLNRAAKPWVDDGYVVKSYEVLPLPLDSMGVLDFPQEPRPTEEP